MAAGDQHSDQSGHSQDEAAPHASNAEHGAPAGEGHEAEAEEHGGGHQLAELPHALFFASTTLDDNGYHRSAKFIHTFENTMYSGFIILCVTLILMHAAKRRMMVPGRLQALLEMIVEGFDGFLCEIMGKDLGRKFLPFLGSIFFFVLFNNWLGFIPLGKAPTSAFHTTFALAITVFITVQIYGIWANGIFGYIYHLMGSPKSIIEWILVPMMFPLHVLSELIKPISLSLRLMGNIMGEDILLMVFALLGTAIAVGIGMGQYIGLPLQFPFVFMSALLGAVQALVFMMLSAVYLFMMQPHDHGEEVSH